MNPFRFFTSSTYSRGTLVGILVALVGATPPALACSECGCSLSSDWSAQGYPDLPGFQASLRFEYYDSIDLRSGTGSVDRAAISYPHDDEIQRETLNRNTWFGLDYVGSHAWGVNFQLPYYDRYHSTIAAEDTAVSESRAAGVGDLRVLARYQQFSMYQSFGVQFGFKLPTGRFDQNFATGPQTGSLLDRGLQLGSGTTDFLAGVSYFRRPMAHLGCFAQAVIDQPLNSREGFTPSGSIGLNAGVRYLNSSAVTPQLQMNLHWDGREHGVNGDTTNSGDTLVFISPGATIELGPKSSAFVFLQLPVYRRVNGLQLQPRSLLSLGLTCKL